MMKKKKLDNKKRQKDEDFLYWLAFVCLCGLIFFPPYFRGLFFPADQRAVLILAVIVASVWWLYTLKTKGIDIMNNPMDWFVVGLLASYIIAFFGAANPELAVNEIVKRLIYFNIFWLASRLVIDYKSATSLVNVIIVSATGVAVAGILSAVGWLDIADGFYGGRIFSTLQYPNALASYLLAVTVLVLAVWQGTDKDKNRYFYLVLAYIMLVVFFGTSSRGAFLIMPITIVLSMANPWLKQRLEALLFWVLLLTGSLVASSGFLPNIVKAEIGLAWLWFFLGLAIVLFGQFLTDKVKEKKLIRAKLPQGRLVLLILVVIILVMAFSWQFILPEQVATRLMSISFDDTSAGARAYWALEAFNMVKENPLFGLGGGAWEASYKYFQGYYYNSTQVHNDFAQVLMEVGYVGLILFVGLWIVMIYMGIRNIRATKNEALINLQWAVMVAAVSLGAHAFIDFDFALSAITIVLFVLFAITTAIYRQNYSPKIWLPNANGAVMGVFAIIVAVQLLLPISLMTASGNMQKALNATEHKKIDEAIVYFEKAKTYNPFSSAFRADLANLYRLQGNYDKAIEYLQSAVERNRYNSRIHQIASDFYLSLEYYEESIEHMEVARDSNRWYQQTWDDLAERYVLVGMRMMEDGDYERAEKYFEKVSKMPEEIIAAMESLGEWENNLWKSSRLSVSADIYLYAGAGKYFTGSFEDAQAYLQNAVDGKSLDALWWQVILKNKKGLESEARNLLEKARQENPDFEDNFWSVLSTERDWWKR